MKDLKHLFELSAVFSDESVDLNDYLRDDISVSYSIGDFYYIGLYKPFKQVYAEFTTVSSSATASATYQYWNGVSWVSLPNLLDDTKAFNRSGFIKWNFDDDSAITDSWKTTTINTEEAYFVRVSFDESITFDAKGINLVYNDDNQLLAEVRLIDDYRATGDTSFIAYHVAARDEIVQSLRNGGNIKLPNVDSNFLPSSSNSVLKKVNLTKWDLLDIGEISQAAKYLALAKIFFDVSENIDDKNYQRYRDYEGMYGSAFKLFYMSIDTNDDGNTSSDEELALNDITVTKV